MKTHLMVHHSLTTDGDTVSWSAITRFHMSYSVGGHIIREADALARIARGEYVRRPWKANGYHLGVEIIDGKYQMLVGRQITSSAAAAPQRRMNHVAIHCCFVGNFDLAPPDQAMLDFALPHLAAFCDLAGITVDREHILGHRDVNSRKSCPGTMFDIDAFVEQLGGEG